MLRIRIHFRQHFNIESISGKFMMNVLCMMMMKSDLLKIMVSVFKTNAIAMKFFKDALKYELDETSPDEAAGEEADVEILSRWAEC